MNHVGLVLTFVYLIAMIFIGILVSKWIRSGEDFLLSGRELGWLVLAGSLAAMQLAGTTVAGYPGTAYSVGWGNLWGAWGWVISAFIFLVLFSRFSRRTGAFTTVEWFEAEFDTVNRIILAFGTIIALLFGGMGQFVGCANIIVGWTGMNYTTAVAVVGIATLIYMYTGGYWATMITDLTQFFLAGLVIYILLPVFLFTKFGGFDYLVSGPNPVPEALLQFPFGTSKVAGLVLPSVIGLIMLNMSFMLANSYYWNKSVATRSERESFKGWLVSLLFIIPFGITTTLAGLYARATWANVQVKDQVFGLLLGSMHPVLAAFMMMAVLAATQSTANAIILGCSTIISRDFIARLFPKANLLNVAKWTTLAVGIASILLAIFFKQGALYGLALMGTFVVPVLPPLAATVLWPRWITKEASASAMAVSCVVGLYWHFATDLWKTVAHTMFVTFFVSAIVMIVVNIVVKFTGPWWKSQRELAREKLMAGKASVEKGVQVMSFRALYCELAKPVIIIKPFVRFVESLAVKKYPGYKSILTERR